MPQYPQKTCAIDRLVRQPKLVASALAGQKTQQRRDGVYGYPGDTFTLQDAEFQITDLFQQALGAMNEADVQAEGYHSLPAYKDLILRMHPGMSWDNRHLVWVHQFRRIDPQATTAGSY